MATSSPKRRRSGQQIKELTRELEALRRQLNRSQRLQTMGTMAAMLAHEFNNILTPMISYTQMAGNSDDPVLREKAVRRAFEGSTRAAAVCRALLDLSGADDEPPRSVQLAQLLEETLAAMARDPAKDGIHLIVKIPSELKVTTRVVELKQILLNLLLNARQAAMAKGRGQSIAVSALRQNGQVLIRVADTGVGIAPENLDRIFEPFYTTRPEGTGLGLAFCRHVSTDLGGRLTVRSQPGKGTCFTIALPARRARVSARAERRPAAKATG